MQLFKTVLGDIREKDLGITLVHEHICCYSEYLFQMAGNKYLDKKQLLNIAVDYFKFLKDNYGLNTFVDCTPVNIGRDVELLKEISEKSSMNIICSTGFYYTEETVLYASSSDLLAEYMIADAQNVNAGIIKCAVEGEEFSAFNIKLLKASAMAQLKLKLPIVLHTNAKNKNGLKALEILLSEGVQPQAITVGHLSDTEDLDCIKQIASKGCFIGFDRLYGNYSEEYIANKINAIIELGDAGYEDKILLSHDASFFNGFDSKPAINKKPRFLYCFDNILPSLPKRFAEKVIIKKQNEK